MGQTLTFTTAPIDNALITVTAETTDSLILDGTDSSSTDAGHQIITEIGLDFEQLDTHRTDNDQIVLEFDTFSASEAGAIQKVHVSNGGAEWPLSKKFGCNSSDAEILLNEAKKLKLIPLGLSFHVGSQQLSTTTWDKAIKTCSTIYKNMAKKGTVLNFINLGGGLPVNYKNKQINFYEYSKSIKSSLKIHFGNLIPSKVILEPGRFLVANTAVIETEVILIRRRGKESTKWIYLDVGRYNGLAETEGEAIKYLIKSPSCKSAKKSSYVIAGPSCDSHDIVYKKNLYRLPKDLKIGDRLRIFCTGAYTTSYETDFNGIKKMKQIFLD